MYILNKIDYFDVFNDFIMTTYTDIMTVFLIILKKKYFIYKDLTLSNVLLQPSMGSGPLSPDVIQYNVIQYKYTEIIF